MNEWPAAARFAELDALLGQALELDAPARAAWLAALGARDPAAAAHVARLLEASESGTLEASVGLALETALVHDTWGGLAPGARLGAWRLLESLGRGGMAEVWLAERDDAGFVQRAALKRLAPGMATPDLVARFEQERQILAQLDDPGVARLLDGGIDDEGLPWLALEYVDGEDVVAWCDARRLGIAARLALWREIAATVAGAHRHLVVHRDLKPSNVLVDRDGRPRLLDFGIAKLLDPQAVPHAAPPTRLGTRALTPEYASPEQIAGHPVTVASDVYQLGLLLYLLLCGHHPFRRAGLTEGEHEHRIAHVAAEAASRVAARDTPEGPAAARALARSTNPRSLAQALRGDLDLILQQALAKTTDARYATVDALLDDVRRHLSREPIRAHPPSLGYRASRFARRNAPWLAAGALALGGITTFLVLTLRHGAALQREADVNRAVRGYVLSLFQEADPGLTGAQQLTAAQMLERGARDATTTFASQPAVQAEMLALLAEVYLARGEPRRALPLAERALTLHRAGSGLPDRAMVDTVYSAAVTHLYLGNLDQAEALTREVAALRAERDGEHSKSALDAEVLLAGVLRFRGEHADAQRLLEARLAALDAGDPALQEVRVRMLQELANCVRDAGEYRASLDHYRRVLALHSQRGDTDVNPMLDGDFARALLLAGEADAARPHIVRGAERDLAKFGDAHFTAAIHARNRALLMLHDGDVDGAVAALERAAAIYRVTTGDQQFYAAQLRIDLGYAWLEAGRVDEADEVFVASHRALMPLRDGGHPAAASARIGSALAAARRGEHDAADRYAAEAVAIRARAFGDAHALTQSALWLRAALLDGGATLGARVRAEVPYEAERLERALAAAAPDRGAE